MNLLKDYTPTELLHAINLAKQSHERLKKEVVDLTYLIDESSKTINEKLDQIKICESNYINLIDEMNDRNLIE